MRVLSVAVIASLAVVGCGPQQGAPKERNKRRQPLSLQPYAAKGHTPPPQKQKLAVKPPAAAGPWQSTTSPISFNASTMLLLTDGRLMVQTENDPTWSFLTPDASGSYINGTWSGTTTMSKARLYYCSAVLKDGRVFVLGGEYTGAAGQTEDATGEIYDPVKNTWTSISGPPGWADVGDASCSVLADGRVLVGSILDTKSAIFDPTTSGWGDGGTKLGASDEESWVALPDGDILTVDCNPSRTDKYELWSNGTWIDGGAMPVTLVEASSQEIGPALRLPDGRVMYFGATGHTAVYTPSATAGQLGTWVAGPDLPTDSAGQVVAKDTPAVLLPNGHVILTASSEGSSGWGGPTNFYDVDTTVAPITIAAVSNPPNNAQAPYEGRMMMRPTGEIVYTQGSAQLAIMNPGVTSIITAPAITSAPAQAQAGGTFQLAGTELTGVSATVSYGDDASQATNYPLVRLTSASGTVVYARTHDHSTMAVDQGTTVETTMVTLPTTLASGTYSLQVVTDGVASASVSITVGSVSCGGCIDAAGACQAGTDASACGTGGNNCVACSANQTCNSSGQCVAAACNGCVDASGACQAGTDASACGTGGSACVACASNQTCQSGSCVTNSCNGCVDASGTCQLGTDVGNCGANGSVCATCPSGDACQSGQCVAVSSCAHDECAQGDPLNSSCDTCVTQLCGQDSYCCSTYWDDICVSEVGSICGKSCPSAN
jgi:hypothetical protein